MDGDIAAAPPQQRHRHTGQRPTADQRADVVPPPPTVQAYRPGPHPRGEGDPLHRVEPVALGAALRGLGQRDPGRLRDQLAGRVAGVRVGGRRTSVAPLADGRQQGLVGLGAYRLTGLDALCRPCLVGALQLLDPAVQRRQQAVLLVHHGLPDRRVDQQVGGRLRAVQRAVLHTAGRHLHPEDVVVVPHARIRSHGGTPVRRGPLGGHRRLEEDGEAAADAEGEGVLQRARLRRHVLRVAVFVVGPGLGVRGLVQLAQPDAVDDAVPERSRHQRVLRPRDGAEQQRARLQPAQVVPVALLPGVDREQVHRAGRHQPQHLRAFEVQAVEPRAVDARAHPAERVENEVALVDGRHLTAP